MNFNNFSNKVNGYEEITDAELRSAIKRINDRLYQLDKANMRDSIAYQSYESFANKFGGISYGKRPSIKVGKLSALSEQDKREILNIDRHGGSLGQETKKAIDYIRQSDPSFANHKGKRTAEENRLISETANKLGKIHEFIEDHDYMIYAVEDAKGDFIRGNNGKLTTDEVERLFNIEYEYNQLGTEAHHDEPTSWAQIESSNTYKHKATPSASNEDYINRINRWS